jgi:transmembrane sensor
MSRSGLMDEPLRDPAVVRQAAQWMARLWSGEASDADRQACEAWRAAHPQHELAWSRLQAFENRLCGVPKQVARQALLVPGSASASRRRTLELLGLAGLVGGLAYGALETETWKVAASQHSTRAGETKQLELPDGTRVVLNTASAIDVNFDARERRIVLHAGEILVTTAPDPASVHRPFIVQDRHGTVRALGTRFTVRQDADSSRVAVFEGAVEIRPVRGGRPVRLDAGLRAVFSDEQVRPPAPVPESAAAWSQGKLVAERMRVADFLAEIARYRPGIVRCAPEVANLEVSGVFSLEDTDRALLNLTLGLPVDLVYRTCYWVTVQAR